MYVTVIDNQVDKTIRVLYNALVKKSGLIQLIAINQNEFRKLATTLTQERFGRRILLHKPERPFIINLNVNINNNINITNNFNFAPKVTAKPIEGKRFQQHQQEEQLDIENTRRKTN